MRKSLMLFGAAAILIIAYFFVITPIKDKTALAREGLDADYTKLVKYRKYASGAQVSKDELSKAREELDKLESAVIREKQEPIAFAELQLRLQEIAGKAGLAVVMIRPLKGVEEAGYKSLPIQLEAEGGIKQVSDFLKTIDGGASYIKVESLEVGNRDLRGEQKQLRVKMRVSGLMKL
jgi:Tfp pilus assembly protein PilO